MFFFDEQYDKAVKYRLLVKQPLALDYAFLAMADAYLGRTTAMTEAAAANVKKLDPTWTAERYLSRGGRLCGKGGRAVRQWRAQGRTIGLRPCRQAQGHVQSDPRQVLRPATRQDVWVTCPLSAQFGAMSAHRQADGRRLHVSQSNVGNWPNSAERRRPLYG